MHDSICKIFDKTWHRLLIPNRNKKSISLFKSEEINDLGNKLLVSFINNQDQRLFSIFNSVTDLFIYQEHFPDCGKCFFEIILGNSNQKPHFDLDIKNQTEEYSEKVKDDLVKSIIKVTSEKGLDLTLEKDILIFSSHGKKKKSYHIIIDNYYHYNNVDISL